MSMLWQVIWDQILKYIPLFGLIQEPNNSVYWLRYVLYQDTQIVSIKGVGQCWKYSGKGMNEKMECQKGVKMNVSARLWMSAQVVQALLAANQKWVYMVIIRGKEIFLLSIFNMPPFPCKYLYLMQGFLKRLKMRRCGGKLSYSGVKMNDVRQQHMWMSGQFAGG